MLEHGARIEDPEYYAFSTQTHTLQHSLGMLNIYRALASQAYISLTSSDPIHTAFERCVKLRKLSQKNPEFSEQFVELAGQCEQFAADILGHIRNHKEQTCVLYHDPYMWGAMEEGEGIGPYKVKIAIHYEQRKVSFKFKFKKLFFFTRIDKTPGPDFIKVKIILSLKFKINLIFYLIKEFMKHSCLNFFYEIVNKINIKVKRN